MGRSINYFYHCLRSKFSFAAMHGSIVGWPTTRVAAGCRPEGRRYVPGMCSR